MNVSLSALIMMDFDHTINLGYMSMLRPENLNNGAFYLAATKIAQ